MMTYDDVMSPSIIMSSIKQGRVLNDKNFRISKSYISSLFFPAWEDWNSCTLAWAIGVPE